jgi:hypothetical protein
VFLAFNEEIIFRGYLFQNLIDVRRRVFGMGAVAPFDRKSAKTGGFSIGGA